MSPDVALGKLCLQRLSLTDTPKFDIRVTMRRRKRTMTREGKERSLSSHCLYIYKDTLLKVDIQTCLPRVLYLNVQTGNSSETEHLLFLSCLFLTRKGRREWDCGDKKGKGKEERRKWSSSYSPPNRHKIQQGKCFDDVNASVRCRFSSLFHSICSSSLFRRVCDSSLPSFRFSFFPKVLFFSSLANSLSLCLLPFFFIHTY